jgi:LmbE family N-acetylglucosaminyl deacetylase
MKILAIGAHPDDIEVGCAGALAKYAHQGHEIHLLIMTEGAKGGDASGRRDEQHRAAEFLQPKSLTWGVYEDTKLTPCMNEMVHDVEQIMDRIGPDFIFVHYDDDTHQDHRALSKATVSATRYVRNVLFYEGPTSQNFAPTVFVDIKETIDRKVSMLLAHQSQVMKTNIKGLSIIDVIKATAMFRGTQGRAQFAEGFMPLRLFINI